MPTTEIEVPGKGLVEFPDGMTEKDIQDVLSKETEAPAAKPAVTDTPERAAKRADLARQTTMARQEGTAGQIEAGAIDLGQRAAYTVTQMAGAPQRALRALIPSMPAVSEENAYEAVRNLSPVPISEGSAAQGVAKFIAENISGLTDPVALAAMISAKGAPVPIARGFQAQMMMGVPESVERLKEAKTVPEGVAAALGVGTSIALPVAIQRGVVADMARAKKLLPRAAAEATKGEPNAPQERQVQENVSVERPGNGQGGTPAEAGTGGSVPPAAGLAEEAPLPLKQEAPAEAPKPDAVADRTRYEELQQSLKDLIKSGRGMTDPGWAPLQKEIEAIKSRYKGMPPPKSSDAPKLAATDIQPALLVDGKPVVGGEDHQAIMDGALKGAPAEQQIKVIQAFDDDANHIFVDSQGNRYTRAEAGKALGEPGPLQSERLKKLKEQAKSSQKPQDAPGAAPAVGEQPPPSAPQAPAKALKPTPTPDALPEVGQPPTKGAGYRRISADELKDPKALGDILTQDARVGGSTRPQTESNRLVAMEGPDGQVHLASVYPHSRSGAMVRDPRSGRHTSLDAMLRAGFKPFASIWTPKAEKGSLRTFANRQEFMDRFGSAAAAKAGEAIGEAPAVSASGEPITHPEPPAPEPEAMVKHMAQFPSVSAATKALANHPDRESLKATLQHSMDQLQQANPKLSGEDALKQALQTFYDQAHPEAKAEGGKGTAESGAKALPGLVPEPPAPKLTPAESARLQELTQKVESGGKMTAKERREYLRLRDKSTGGAAPGKPGVEAGPDPTANLYATLFPPVGLRQFIKSDLAPLLKKGVDAGKAFIDFAIDTLSPASHTKSGDVDTLFEGKGFKEKVMTRVAAAVEAAENNFSRMPQTEQIAFIDRVKRGLPQPTPELQAVADLLRKWDDTLISLVRRYKPEAAYLENHYRVLWKVIPGKPQIAGTTAAGIGSKRPFAGRKGFLKQHVLEDMSEGLALGGVPVTYNPVEMFLLHAQDVMKFVAANRAWEGLKKTGTAKFVRQFHKPPEGFVRFDDPIAKPYFRTAERAVGKPGEWYVEEGAARMLHNYLSMDFIRYGKFGPAGRSLLALKNFTTNIELGLSPFHFFFESNEVAASSLGLGIAKMFSGQFKAGAEDFLRAIPSTLAPLTFGLPGAAISETLKTGRRLAKYAKNPQEFAAQDPKGYAWLVNKYPGTQQLVNDLFTGGGQIDMHPEYRYQLRRGFRQAVAEGNTPGAIVRVVPALNELMQGPLFEHYIPRLKLGMFLREYSFELSRRAGDLAAGKITRSELARKVWAFNEDRFGELNWDNLYWNRTFKSISQLAFRSVTWKLGNLRGFGKAGRDVWSEVIQRGLSGEAPRMTLPLAWIVGLSAVTAVQASVITKVSTGKWPWELAKRPEDQIKNLTFPRIDKDDPTQRVSIPTYFRDAVHIYHSLGEDYGVGYVKGSMSGEISRLMENWENKDFSGKPIYNPLDPLHRQVENKLLNLVPLPFGVSSYQRGAADGSAGIRPELGLMGYPKAPAWVDPSTSTKVQKLVQDWEAKSTDPKVRETARRNAIIQQRHAQEPSRYADLKRALRGSDTARAEEEYRALTAKGATRQTILQSLEWWRPVTGSLVTEGKFKRSLNAEDRQLYDQMQAERKRIYQKFLKLRIAPPARVTATP